MNFFTTQTLFSAPPPALHRRLSRIAKILVIAATATIAFYNPIQAQCMQCLENVQLKLKDNCEGTVNPYFLASNPTSCSGVKTVEYFDTFGNYISDTLNIDYLGQIVPFKMTNTWTNDVCWGTVVVVDNRGPEINCENIELNCTQDFSTAAIGTPTAVDNCSEVMTFFHQDTTIELGCGTMGFQEYFTPSSWDACLPNGDGGVDASGAPDSIIIEGANNQPTNTSPRYLTRYKIEIPADGYVTFDWKSTGGTNYDIDAFYITVNNVCVQLSSQDTTCGTFTTWDLHPGDILAFEQFSDGNQDMVSTTVSNFHFVTSALKVINRTWTATDSFGNEESCTQVITLRRASFDNIQFPINRDGIAAPMLECGADPDPNITGFPFVDDDGDLTTTSDQYEVTSNGECTFAQTYEDQIVPSCGSSYIVIRTWTIVDDCTNHIIQHPQVIKVFDTTAPSMVCPGDMLVSTSELACSATVTLPSTTATDDCEADVTILPNWAYGTGFGPFENVAPGIYPVTYKAIDACGNFTECTINVTVADYAEPTPVCDGFTVLTLSSDGDSFLFAESIDDGSFDHCCNDLTFAIKYADAPDSEFAPSMAFTCDDVGSFMVEMSVTDCNDNTSICEVEVTVEDKDEPALSCPADITINCTDDYSNLSIYGEATAYDNCGFTLTSTESTNIAGCGEGTIIRSWTATDPYGNSSMCEQIITLENQTPWNTNNDQITWPLDFAADNGCTVSLDPTELSAPYNGPTFSNNAGCNNIAITYDDEIFWIAEPSCYTLVRTWGVIDWCQYEPNSTDQTGLWEYQQTLVVTDNNAPEFINPTNNLEIMMNNPSTCTANITLPFPEIADCSDHVTITASSDLGAGFGPFEDVAQGLYYVTYNVTDGCGNNATHTYTVTVMDDLAPTPICLGGLIVDLLENGEVTIDASLLAGASFDNCTSSQNLVLSFSQDNSITELTFDCDDIGQVDLEIWITDLAGNQAMCPTFILVGDAGLHCEDPIEFVDIAGLVITEIGTPINQVEMRLNGGMIINETNDESGAYSFTNVPTGSDYSITPEKDINPLNGVTTYDLAILSEHILQTNPFVSPYKYIAADVNNNGIVTTSDGADIMEAILFITDGFEDNTSWRFVEENHLFPTASDIAQYPEVININNLQIDNLDAHFIGVKIGDLNDTTDPSELGDAAEDRGSEEMVIHIQDQALEAGEIYSFTFESHQFEALKAYQFTLDFDAAMLEYVGYLPEELYDINIPNFGTSHLTQGKLTHLWYNQSQVNYQDTTSLFSLTFRATQDVLLSEVLDISSALTPALAYNEDAEEMNVRLNYIEVADENEIEIETPNEVNTGYELFQNQPNPFITQTMIGFTLPEAAQATITFYNVDGKILHSIEGGFAKGNNELTVKMKDLKSHGLILYKLVSDDFSAVKKMILLN